MSEKKPEKPRRQALIVLGMHRSGTSALAGVLAKLGVQPPKGLMPPTPDNPRGYWESSALMEFHDRVLESAGTRWSDWDRFNEDWIDSPVGFELMGQLAPLLQQEYGDARLFLVKDPRMCRLLPLWLRVLGELEITPKIVIPVRNPLEVSDSLAARDHITRMRSQLIWLRHILDAEFGSRNLARTFIRYPDLLFDWRSQVKHISNQLDLKWPRWSSAVEAEIETYLSSELRHHAAQNDSLPDSSEIGSWVARTYRAIEVLANGGGHTEALRELDEVRREFDHTSATYAPVLYEVRGDLEQKADKSGRDFATATGELGELNGRHELLKQENQANYELAMSHKAALDDLREQYRNRENTHARLEAKYEMMQADIAQRLQVHEAELENVSGKTNTRLADLADKLQSSEAAYSELKLMCESLSAELETQSGECGSEDETTLHPTGNADIAIRLQDGIKELKVAKRLAEESVQERFAEVAALSKRVLDLEARVRDREASLRELGIVRSTCLAENLTLQETLGESGSRIRAMQFELEVQAQLVSEYRSKLEDTQSSACWRLTGAARRLTRKSQVIIEEVPKPDEQLLRDSKLFDSTWYLKRYPDVRSRGMDPIKHYLRYGAKEGRDPSPAFSTAGYRTRYPDVASAAINPLIHYLKYGRNEGRAFLALDRVVTDGINKRAKKD